jgi:hypothetical protein
MAAGYIFCGFFCTDSGIIINDFERRQINSNKIKTLLKMGDYTVFISISISNHC